MKTLGAGASGQGFAIVDRQAIPDTHPRINGRYWLAVIMLVLAACLWGFGNVAQKIVLQDLSAPTLLFIRSAIALSCLIPLSIKECGDKKIRMRQLWKHRSWLLVTAVSFALGLACQTYGGQFTSATNLGFIINLCVLITPLLLFVAFKEKISKLTILSCIICFVGAALLTGLHMQLPNAGDALCFIGAIFYAVWIISLDRCLKVVDAPITITALQFVPTCLLGVGMMSTLDVGLVGDFWQLVPALLFVSILSTFVSFLMAAYAQRLVQPVVAGLIYSFEALFGAFGAWLMLGEKLTASAMIGGGMMFTSILVCQYCVCRKPETQNHQAA